MQSRCYGTGRVYATAAWMVLSAAIGGCGGFGKQWAQTTAVVQPPADIIGAWSGTWSSEATGHDGALRCIITRVDQNIYSARFHARFMKILSAQYTTILHVTVSDGVWHITGESDLGWFGGGLYRQEGEIRDGIYAARYESKGDRGLLRMSRPGEEVAGGDTK